MTAEPKAGDVIFGSSRSVKAKKSGLIQRVVDLAARWAPATYEHAAIVMSPTLALEASPDPGKFPADAPDPVIQTTVEFGKWTKSELQGGVRLIPIADLAMKYSEPWARLKVLRPPEGVEPSPPLGYSNPEIQRLLGSEYSIEPLLVKTKPVFDWLPKCIRDLFVWRSEPNTIASHLALGAEARAQLAKIIPGIDLPPNGQTYFCSQLVVEVLALTGLRSRDGSDPHITPSGLRRSLARDGWRDVSQNYKGEPSADRYQGRTALDWRADYTRSLRLAMFGQSLHQQQVQIDILTGVLEKARHLWPQTGPEDR